MSLEEIHHKMVNDLAKEGYLIAEEMTAESAHMLHMAVGISGESGELLDAIKKVVIYQKMVNRENIVEELGDLEFYMQGLREGLHITRDETLEANIKKLGIRYGDEYSDLKAQVRADKIEGE